ncbi:MAG: AAA family ATPase, partial [Planctomycetaceae bacterium]|nr:AAA family ATPase [Planctomycetaceae bacterium]
MLKSLDLFGFKSFADRTAFDFAPGVTCVVGPNGSGKSNVVDALKWILGDQSAKSLRGKEMTDVIFNGAAGRKPAGYAEATLTFDNTEGHLVTEHQEVQIGRRLYRSGESEYLINKLPVRLKDVRDLFLGTGSSAYSIIEQGRVDALLQTTTQNRRAVFEEAAGISRFNQRKQDALRKLERVGQNLLRLTDIVDEVRSQLESVRSQAGKAAKFREYSEELKHLRVGLAADDLRSWTAELEEIDLKSQGISEKIAVLTEEHQIAEKNQAEVDRKVAEVEDLLRAAERKAAQNREEIAGHEATITHQHARQTELESELERLMLQQQELASRSYQAVGELQETEGTLQQFAEELETRSSELKSRADQLSQLTAMIDDARETLEQDRARQLELLQLISVLGNRGSTFLSRFDALKMTEQRILGRISHLDEDIAATRAELAGRREEIGSASATLAELRGEVQAAKQRREEKLIQIEEIQRGITEQREERSAIDARRAVLEDLERRQEGLGIGVKEILSRASSGISPWNTVMGSVAELLVVDLEDAALLEVALGARSQTIIVSDLDPLVEYIQAGKCRLASRVGFVSALPPLDRGGEKRDSILWQEGDSSQTTLEQLGDREQIDLSGHP